MNDDIILAAVEGGGTSFVVSIVRLHSTNNTNEKCCWKGTKLELLQKKCVDSSSIPPKETLSQCASFFQSSGIKKFSALGVASFGPVGVDPNDKDTYGQILASSPKKEWRNVDLISPLLDAVGGKDIPFLIDTDVNAPAWAEYIYNNNKKKKKLSSIAYVTVGTGVGVGLVIHGKPVHGMMHPEGGHVTVKPLPNDTFTGYSWGTAKSPYGGVHTVEGIASSVALTERYHQRLLQLTNATDDDDEMDRNILANIPDSDELWDHTANALANLCVSLALLTSVEKIVFGGGVMKRTCLYDKIRTQFQTLLNGYLPNFTNNDKVLQQYIQPSLWNEDSGLVGALVLAEQAYEQQKIRTSTNRSMEQSSHSRQHNFLRGLILTTASIVALTTIIMRPRQK